MKTPIKIKNRVALLAFYAAFAFTANAQLIVISPTTTFPVVLSQINSNFSWLAANGGTNGSYLLKSFGAGNDLTITNSFTLISSNTIYTLQSISVSSTNPLLDGTFYFNAITGVFTNTNGISLALLLGGTNADLADLDASNFLARASITNDLLTQLAVQLLTRNLKAAGLWTNLYAVYPFIGGTTNSDAQNLLGTNYTIAWRGYLTNAAAHSVSGIDNSAGGPDAAGDTGFSPAVGWSTNSASFGVWVQSLTGSGGAFMASCDSQVGWQTSFPYSWYNSFFNAVAAGASHTSVGCVLYVAYTNSFCGLFVSVSKTSAYNTVGLIGTNVFYSYDTTCAALSTSNILIAGTWHDVSSFNAFQGGLGFAFIGPGLTTNQLAALSTIVSGFNSWRTNACNPTNHISLSGLPSFVLVNGLSITNTLPGTNVIISTNFSLTFFTNYYSGGYLILPSCGNEIGRASCRERV